MAESKFSEAMDRLSQGMAEQCETGGLVAPVKARETRGSVTLSEGGNASMVPREDRRMNQVSRAGRMTAADVVAGDWIVISFGDESRSLIRVESVAADGDEHAFTGLVNRRGVGARRSHDYNAGTVAVDAADVAAGTIAIHLLGRSGRVVGY